MYHADMKKFFAPWVALFLGGCASLEDFRAMPPADRAEYVCERHWETRQIAADLDSAESFAADSEIALSRGYRLHRACELVPVVVSTTERCKTEEDGEKVCKEVSELSHKEVCKDQPVAIDGPFEQEKLAGYRRQIGELQAEYDAAYNSCFAKVRAMGAEEAFDFYEESRSGGISF